MEYNQHKKLLMPTYGRNVQRMVEHAITLPTREERNRCADAILHTMANLHPELNNSEQQHTFYDHLAIMSDFRLDIDYPYGMPKPEDTTILPAHIEYNQRHTTYRHYGKIVQNMVAEACQEQDIERRHFLINALANRLKFCYVRWNKDSVEEQQIIEDIHRMSDGQLSCDFEGFQLLHAWQMQPAKSDKENGKKKKKR